MFAIVRYDGDSGAPSNRVTVTKIVGSETIARAATDRLNKLNGPAGSVYFYQVTRLVE